MAAESDSSVHLVEVGLRDGLQAVSQVLPTSIKLRILELVLEAGFKTIEITSFAHPKVLPQFQDAKELIDQAPKEDDVTYRALAPNLRGVQRATETTIDEITMVLPVDKGMAQKNQNASPEELIEDFRRGVEVAHLAGKRIIAGIATAFFAPCRGAVPRHELQTLVHSALEAGADAIYIAGTTGMELPQEFSSTLDQFASENPNIEVGVHLHNRNGFGLVNAMTSLEHGASWIEASFGGLGGDMWFPGDPSVLGNLPMEDLLNLMHSYSIQTGIDLPAYLRAVEYVERVTEVPSYSFIRRGGTREALASASWPE